MNYSAEELQSLSYSELKTLSKSLGLTSKGKSEKLIQLIVSHQTNETKQANSQSPEKDNLEENSSNKKITKRRKTKRQINDVDEEISEETNILQEKKIEGSSKKTDVPKSLAKRNKTKISRAVSPEKQTPIRRSIRFATPMKVLSSRKRIANPAKSPKVAKGETSNETDSSLPTMAKRTRTHSPIDTVKRTSTKANLDVSLEPESSPGLAKGNTTPSPADIKTPPNQLESSSKSDKIAPKIAKRTRTVTPVNNAKKTSAKQTKLESQTSLAERTRTRTIPPASSKKISIQQVNEEITLETDISTPNSVNNRTRTRSPVNKTVETPLRLAQKKTSLQADRSRMNRTKTLSPKNSANKKSPKESRSDTPINKILAKTISKSPRSAKNSTPQQSRLDTPTNKALAKTLSKSPKSAKISTPQQLGSDTPTNKILAKTSSKSPRSAKNSSLQKVKTPFNNILLKTSSKSPKSAKNSALKQADTLTNKISSKSPKSTRSYIQEQMKGNTSADKSKIPKSQKQSHKVSASKIQKISISPKSVKQIKRVTFQSPKSGKKLKSPKKIPKTPLTLLTGKKSFTPKPTPKTPIILKRLLTPKITPSVLNLKTPPLFGTPSNKNPTLFSTPILKGTNFLQQTTPRLLGKSPKQKLGLNLALSAIKQSSALRPIKSSNTFKTKSKLPRLKLTKENKENALKEAKLLVKNGEGLEKLFQGKDFKKIHQKAAEKMESIGDYHERKKAHREELQRSSIKLAASVSAKRLKKSKPKAKLDDSIVLLKKLVKTDPLNKPVSFSRSMKAKGRSSVAANTNLNSSLQRRQSFDVQASLSRKLNYKPHTGTLKSHGVKKPLDQSINLETSKLQNSNILRGVRKNKRFDLQMLHRTLELE